MSEPSGLPATSRSSAAGGAPLTEAAFTDALLRYQWPLYAFLRGFVLNDEQARDLTQDVFCDAWRARQRAAAPFTISQAASGADDGAIHRWLFHTAYQRAISARRRTRLIRWESLDAHVASSAGDAPTTSDASAARDQGPSADTLAAAFVEPFTASFEDQLIEGQTLRAALASLSPADVATLLLNIVHGFTTAEIAQVIGATPDGAKKRLSRAKRRLRDSYLAQNAGELRRADADPAPGSSATPTEPTRKERRV